MIKERVSRRNWRFENEEEVKPSAMRLSLGLNKRQLFLQNHTTLQILQGLTD